MIPVLKPRLPTADEILPYLRRIDAAQRYTNHGQLVRELETHLQKYYNGQVVTVANATLGIQLALASLGLPRGARVLVPSLSFPATAAAVVRSGFEPLYADVDRNTWCLTPELAKTALQRWSYDAVIPVATFGAPLPVKLWEAFELMTGVKVIFDMAATFENQPYVGYQSQVVSLHATKALGAGEGGFIATTDAHRATSMQRLANFGIDPTSGNGLVQSAGINAKMSEYHAAVALAGLSTWPQQRADRSLLSQWYHSALAPLASAGMIALQDRPPAMCYSAFTIVLSERYPVRHVQLSMQEGGIETRRWYCPPQHAHPGLRYIAADELTVTNSLGARLLGLPFYRDLTHADVQKVVHVLERALV